MYQIAHSRYLQNRFHYFIFPEHYRFKRAKKIDCVSDAEPYYVWKLSKLLKKTKKKYDEDSDFRELTDMFFLNSPEDVGLNLNEIGVNVMVSHKGRAFKTLLCNRFDSEFDIVELLDESDIDVNLIADAVFFYNTPFIQNFCGLFHLTSLESLIRLRRSGCPNIEYIRKTIVKLVRHGAVMAIHSELPCVEDPQIVEFVKLCAVRSE